MSHPVAYHHDVGLTRAKKGVGDLATIAHGSVLLDGIRLLVNNYCALREANAAVAISPGWVATPANHVKGGGADPWGVQP